MQITHRITLILINILAGEDELGELLDSPTHVVQSPTLFMLLDNNGLDMRVKCFTRETSHLFRAQPSGSCGCLPLAFRKPAPKLLDLFAISFDQRISIDNFLLHSVKLSCRIGASASSVCGANDKFG